MKPDRTLDELLNTVNETEVLQIMSVGNGGEFSIFSGKQEEKDFLEGNLSVTSVEMQGNQVTISEKELPGLGSSIQVLGGKPQYLKGPNSPIVFTINWLKVYKVLGFTSTDFALRLYLEQHLWYYNYIAFTYPKIASYFGISEQSVLTSVNKFRSCGILEKLSAKQVPQETKKMGTWYRVSIDFLWMGKISELEQAPSGYTISRRGRNPEKKTLKDSYVRMVQTNRI